MKAIALLYSPKSIYDFIWYYSTYGKKFEWTAICGWYGVSNASLELCKKTGIFEDVIWVEQRYDTLNTASKIKEFLKMFWYYITGRKSKYCDDVIRNCIGDIEYERAVVWNSHSILFGAVISKSKEKDIVILEDGTADYIKKDLKYLLHNLTNINEIVGFMMAKMDYANPMMGYSMKSFKNCIKFNGQPERVPCDRYKEVRLLGDKTETDLELYEDVVYKTFNIEREKMSGDVIIFTAPLYEQLANSDDCICRVEEFINEKYKGKKVILKKHPRDTIKYTFKEVAEIVEVEHNIPGEVLLSYLEVKDVYFFWTCSLLFTGDRVLENAKVFFFKDSMEVVGPQKRIGTCYGDTIRKDLDNAGISEDVLIYL